MLDKLNYLKIFNEKHNNKFDYSRFIYVNAKTKGEIECPIHGYFLQSPSQHIRKHGCAKCSRTVGDKLRKRKKESIMNEIYSIHGNKYEYINFNFDKMTDKGEIICEKHGIFMQSPKCHIRGQGCPKCVIRYGSINLFNKDKYNFFLNKPGKLYFIKLNSKKENFYKIGISNNKNYKNRIKLYEKYYNTEILHFIEGDMATLFTLEQLILKENKSLLYKPIINFAGKTECFEKNPYVLYRNLENNYYEWNQQRIENYESNK